MIMDYNFYLNALREKYDSKLEVAIKNNDEKMIEKIEKRFTHSVGVCEMAIDLANIFNLNVDREKLKIASILHDYAKFETLDEYKAIAKEYKVEYLYNEDNLKVLHAILGPYVIKKELDLDDEEILKAIETHSTGNNNMTIMQELVYIADCVEVNRLEDYFTPLRRLAKKNYKKAIAVFLKDTIERISEEGKKLHEYTLNAFQDYKKYLINAENLYEQVIESLDHNLIYDVNIFDARLTSSLYDYVIVATTQTSRQMDACVNYLRDDFDVRGVEKGEDWTLIDLNDVIVHIFKTGEREKYAIDRLYVSMAKIELNK